MGKVRALEHEVERLRGMVKRRGARIERFLKIIRENKY